MSRAVPLLSLAVLLAGLSTAQEPAPVAAEIVPDERVGGPVVKGQLLVTPHGGVTEAELKTLFERFGAKVDVVGKVALTNTYVLATDHDRLPELRQRLENHPYIAAAGFNGVEELAQPRAFNDPVFRKPADMPEDKDNWNLYRIKVPEAWEITTGGAVVAVIDSGAKLDHEDLVGRTQSPYSFATRGPTMQEGVVKEKFGPTVFRVGDVRNHGTHVAVTIGGRAGNGVGTAGVAPDSPLLPIQALYFKETFPDEKAGTLTTTNAEILAALAMAMERRAAAVNMSLGFVSKDQIKTWREAKTEADREDAGQQLLARAETMLQGFAPALDEAARTRTIFVNSAGNDGIPAEFGHFALSRRTICVAATDRDDKRAVFDPKNPNSSSNYGSFTTVSAPGKDIWSAVAEKDVLYKMMSGTSMASPHAAGVVGLMKSVDPDLTTADAAAILIATGRPLETDRPIGPLINARAAVEETRRRRAMNVREPVPEPIIPPPDMNLRQPELPKDAGNLIGQPAPWTNANVRRVMRVWLAFAIAAPPPGGDPNVRWFFNRNGQLVNTQTAALTPRPVWARFNDRWLWENAGQLNSTNLGTLFEFTAGTLKAGTFDPAPTGRVPENVRPGPKDVQPRPGMPLAAGLGKSKWAGANGKGDKVEFDFGDKEVSVKWNGQVNKYVPRINAYHVPPSMSLYPVGGGAPIRCRLHVTDLDKVSVRTDFTPTWPKDAGPNDPDAFKLDRTDLPPPSAVAGGRGFADGDGKTVDARFAAAEISDGASGGAGDIGKFAGSPASAGPRSAIVSVKLNKGVPLIGHSWAIREFKDAGGAAAYIAKSAKDPRYTVKTFDSGTAGFIVKARDIGADHIVDTTEAYAKVGLPYEMSSHTNTFVYRDKFLVTFSLWEGRRGYDFKAESAAIVENSKKLIDTRFPKE